MIEYGFDHYDIEGIWHHMDDIKVSDIVFAGFKEKDHPKPYLVTLVDKYRWSSVGQETQVRLELRDIADVSVHPVPIVIAGSPQDHLLVIQLRKVGRRK